MDLVVVQRRRWMKSGNKVKSKLLILVKFTLHGHQFNRGTLDFGLGEEGPDVLP